MKISATTPISNSSDQPISNSIAIEREWAQRGPPRAGDILRKDRQRQSRPRARNFVPQAGIFKRAPAMAYRPGERSAGLGGVTAASDRDKPTLAVFDIDIDHRNGAAGAADRGGGRQARGHRRAQVIDAEIDRRHDGAKPQRDREIAGRVDQPGERPAMPLPRSFAALKLGPQLHIQDDPAGGGIDRVDPHPAKPDEGRTVEHRLNTLDGHRRGGRLIAHSSSPAASAVSAGSTAVSLSTAGPRSSRPAARNSSRPGNSVRSSSPKWARKAGVVAQLSGRPGLSRRPRGRTQPASISRSSVPFASATPRIASISARVTG